MSATIHKSYIEFKLLSEFIFIHYKPLRKTKNNIKLTKYDNVRYL